MFTWKKLTAAILTSLIGLVFAAASAEAATLTLVNQSASEIHAIYISDSGSNDWEENVIEGYMLPSGNQLDIQIPSYRSFDLRVEDEDGDYEDYRNFPGNTRQITIRGGGQSQYR